VDATWLFDRTATVVRHMTTREAHFAGVLLVITHCKLKPYEPFTGGGIKGAPGPEILAKPGVLIS